MRAFETVHSEPRNSVDSTRYRVDFWEEGVGWALDAYVLVDVEDLSEALRWVNEHSNGRRFELFAEMDHEPVLPFGTPRTAGLVRLMGRSPNEGESVVIGRAHNG